MLIVALFNFVAMIFQIIVLELRKKFKTFSFSTKQQVPAVTQTAHGGTTGATQFQKPGITGSYATYATGKFSIDFVK